MISIMKEICIFMIIVQGILCFVPGNAYMKYVRILVGIILILRISEPLFQLFAKGDVKQEIEWEVSELKKSIALGQQELEIEDCKMGIYSSIEEELKERLGKCESDYEIRKVELLRDENAQTSGNSGNSSGDSLRISITVSRKKEQGTSGQENLADMIRIEPVVIRQKGTECEIQEQELKKQYSECIGVSAENIDLILWPEQ